MSTINGIITKGTKGFIVEFIQERLNEYGINVTVDGDFGNATEVAVKEFQTMSGLYSDGKVGPMTAEVLEAAPEDLSLLHLAMDSVAKELGIELATLKAVREIESNGNGFLEPNIPVILFERHWMYRRLRDAGLRHKLYAKVVPAIVNIHSGGYLGYADEWLRLGIAKSIDLDCALESCSWGAYQIMGFHWKALGFTSVVEMVEMMSKNRVGQLEVFSRFIKSDPRLVSALQQKNFTLFARVYNGPNYKVNNYDVKLEIAYNKFR